MPNMVCGTPKPRKAPLGGVCVWTTLQAIRACGHRDVTFLPHRAEVATAIHARVHPGDIVITQGAGAINQCGVELLALLKDGK